MQSLTLNVEWRENLELIDLQKFLWYGDQFR